MRRHGRATRHLGLERNTARRRVALRRGDEQALFNQHALPAVDAQRYRGALQVPRRRLLPRAWLRLRAHAVRARGDGVHRGLPVPAARVRSPAARARDARGAHETRRDDERAVGQSAITARGAGAAPRRHGALRAVARAQSSLRRWEARAGPAVDVGAESRCRRGAAHRRHDHDLHVAQALGIRCVLVPSGHQSRERLVQTGATLVDSLEHVAQHLG